MPDKGTSRVGSPPGTGEGRPEAARRPRFRPPQSFNSVTLMKAVHAAGGVVLRDGRVAVVHRPRYDDWSLPKGKLDPDESFEDAALREVEEETGLRCRLVRELPAVEYDVRGRPKLVRYWSMEVMDETPFVPNEEVDEVRWLEPREALAVLSYDRDREPILAL
jgi:8-oxo-dGTP diphosphatase